MSTSTYPIKTNRIEPSAILGIDLSLKELSHYASPWLLNDNMNAVIAYSGSGGSHFVTQGIQLAQKTATPPSFPVTMGVEDFTLLGAAFLAAIATSTPGGSLVNAEPVSMGSSLEGLPLLALDEQTISVTHKSVECISGFDVPPSDILKRIRQASRRLDGSLMGDVMLLSGLSREELEEIGGV